MRAALLLPSALLVLACAAPAQAEQHYPLDDIARVVPVKGPMRCPEIDLVTRKGDPVRWASPLRVNPAFDKQLAAFEKVVAEVGVAVLGRAPKTMTHLGSYNCRRIRRYPDLLSEHGLGNAIDVAGFVFPALPKSERATSALPRRYQRAVTVTVLKDWDDDTPAGRFLRALTAELEKRPEIFRVMLGPAYPGHDDHFHFDMAPYRLVQL